MTISVVTHFNTLKQIIDKPSIYSDDCVPKKAHSVSDSAEYGDCYSDESQNTRQKSLETVELKYVSGCNKACGRFRTVFTRFEGYVCAALIALLTAFAAAYIDTGVQFLADLRVGVCEGLFWLDRSHCCGSPLMVDYSSNRCLQISVADMRDKVYENNGSSDAAVPIVRALESDTSLKQENLNYSNHFDYSCWSSWTKIFRYGVFNYGDNNRSSLNTVEQSSRFNTVYVLDYFLYVLISTLLAFSASMLVTLFSMHACGSGIPEIKAILGGVVLKGVLGGWTLLVKIFGLCLSVGSGLSVGKEGPMVHVACCFGNLIGRYSLSYADEEKRKELLSAASAAGVSVAFGAPLGGVLFSLEEISTHFPPRTLWKSFFCAVVACIALKSINGEPKLTKFQLDTAMLSGSWETLELIPFCMLGILGGFLGSLFIRLNTRYIRYKRKKKWKYSMLRKEALMIGLLSGILNYPFPMLRETSSLLLANLFSSCHSDVGDSFGMCHADVAQYRLDGTLVLQLVSVLVIRFFQTIFVFGAAVPAGLFIPSLTIGGSLGRLVGLLVVKLNISYHLLRSTESAQPGVYALVGALAVLGGCTRMTISLVVIMIELTGGLSYVVPFMLVVMVSKWVGDMITEEGVYDSYIRIKGYSEPFQETNNETIGSNKTPDIIENNLVTIDLENNTLETFRDLIRRHRSFSGFPLVNNNRERLLIGFISTNSIIQLLKLNSSNQDASVFFSKFIQKTTVPAGIDQFYSNDTENGGSSDHFHEMFMIRSSKDKRFLTGENSTGHIMVNCFDISNMVNEDIVVVSSDTSVRDIILLFRQNGARFCFLCRNRKLEGLLTRKRLIFNE